MTIHSVGPLDKIKHAELVGHKASPRLLIMPRGGEMHGRPGNFCRKPGTSVPEAIGAGSLRPCNDARNSMARGLLKGCPSGLCSVNARLLA
jgi:hypothetical protein